MFIFTILVSIFLWFFSGMLYSGLTSAFDYSAEETYSHNCDLINDLKRWHVLVLPFLLPYIIVDLMITLIRKFEIKIQIKGEGVKLKEFLNKPLFNEKDND